MTTKANSQHGMRSSKFFLVQFSVNSWSLFLKDLPHFTSPNRTKMSANKSLKSRTKMSANKSFKSKSSRELWGKAAQIQMFRSVNNAILRPDLLVQFQALAGMCALHLCGDQARLAFAGSCGPSLRMHVSMWNA